MPPKELYWVNGLNKIHWEIVGPHGRVERFIEKTSDDSNRSEANRAARELNEAFYRRQVFREQ
jgi:hypothetical protein